MAPRGDSAATDIARQNADVFITAGLWLVRVLVPISLVCFSVAAAIGLHDHVAVTPGLWFHRLGAGYAGGSLRHLIVTLLLIFVGVTLQALVLCRNAIARGVPSALLAILAGVQRAVLPVIGSPLARATSFVGRDPDSGILAQLRSALSIAPEGPPALLLSARTLGVPSDSQVVERRSL